MIAWVAALSCLAAPQEKSEPFDPLDWARSLDELDLSWQWGEFAFKVSGELDLEAYFFGDESSGVTAEDSAVRSDKYSRSARPDSPEFGGRLRTFLDGTFRDWLEFSIEARADGTTSVSGEGGARLEQYWARANALQGESPLSFQVGKFAAPVGNFIPRSSSKRNPMATWPLPYDHLTALTSLEDTVPGILVRRDAPDVKDWYVPIWREVYGTGVMGFGTWGDLTVHLALLNSAPGTLPFDWDRKAGDPDFYTFYFRAVYPLDVTTKVGTSWSRGAFEKSDPNTGDAEDEPQTLFGLDIEFATGHLEMFAEAYWTRFETPLLKELDLWTWYVEAKVAVTASLYGAVRLAQMYFGEAEDGAGESHQWDRDVSRVEVGGGYLFTPNFFVKSTLQLNYQMGGREPNDHLLAMQVGLTF